MKNAIITLVLIAGGCFAVKAQVSSSANQNTALSLSNAIAITFASNGSSSGSSVNMPFSTVNDFANGVTSSAQSLNVQSNKPFNVSVNTTGFWFSYSGSGSNPFMWISSVLGVQVVANNTGGTIASSYNNNYGSLSYFNQTLLSSCSNGGNQSFNVQYKANPGFSFPAGTYTANVVYTATQP